MTIDVVDSDENRAIVGCINRITGDITHQLPCWVCGGAVRDLLIDGTIYNDIDIFFKDQDSWEKGRKFFESIGFEEERETPNALLLSKPGDISIDLVKIPYEGIVDTLERFDIEICQVGVKGSRLYASQGFLQSKDNYDITFTKNGFKNPGASLWRALKLVRRGYNLDYNTFIYMCIAINKIDTEKEGIFNHLY